MAALGKCQAALQVLTPDTVPWVLQGFFDRTQLEKTKCIRPFNWPLFRGCEQQVPSLGLLRPEVADYLKEIIGPAFALHEDDSRHNPSQNERSEPDYRSKPSTK
jgi:hypothetical protein